MNRYTFERAIIARLRQQGCRYIDEESTPYSMLFYHDERKLAFFIPRPTRDEGWSLSQLNFIERLLEALELDFLPLDYLF